MKVKLVRYIHANHRTIALTKLVFTTSADRNPVPEFSRATFLIFRRLLSVVAIRPPSIARKV